MSGGLLPGGEAFAGLAFGEGFGGAAAAVEGFGEGEVSGGQVGRGGDGGLELGDGVGQLAFAQESAAAIEGEGGFLLVDGGTGEEGGGLALGGGAGGIALLERGGRRG